LDNIELQNKYRGCLVGLAVGDALGVPLEFQPRGALPKVTEMIGGGVFYLQPGEWTDDTSMALCLAQSLLDCDGFDAKDQMDKYWKWVEEGYMSSNGRMFDIGNTTSDALCEYRMTGNPLAGSPDPQKAGNGSLMRLAPIPLFFRNGTHMINAKLSSWTTHGVDDCLFACELYSELIDRCLRGFDKKEVLAFEESPWESRWGTKVGHIARFGSKIPLSLSENLMDDRVWSFGHETSGYVLHTLKTSIEVFSAHSNFEDGLIRAVNLAGDADTTGAVYGQLAGAYYGFNAIPKRWLDKLVKLDMIVEMADKLLERAKT